MIPLKKPNLLRRFNFPVTATYYKYVSFLENFAPCISGFLIGIIFQDFLNVIDNNNNFSKEPLAKFKILFEGKARGGEKAQYTGVHEHFSPTINEVIG